VIRRFNLLFLSSSISALMASQSTRGAKKWRFSNLYRAMDSSDDWEAEKAAEKRARYAPVLDFSNPLPKKQEWTLLQFNFTGGVRGSISNVHRTSPLSFLSALKALGITSRFNLERFRKASARRAFEAHDLLLRSYYAAKSSSSADDDVFFSLLQKQKIGAKLHINL